MDQNNQGSTLLKILEQQPFFQTIKITQSANEFVDKYPHIEITLQEVFDEIQKLKHRKDHALKMNQLTRAFSNWSTQEYYQRSVERMESIMQAKGVNTGYQVEKGRNFEILAFFCYYFANDETGMKQHCTDSNFYHSALESLSTDKGIMIMGNTGRGKTLLFKAFSQNPRRSYQFVEAKYIRDEYKSKELAAKSTGIEVIRHFSSDFTTSSRSMFNQSSFDLCIDDFGVEEPVNIYGDKSEVVLDVLMSRLNSSRITHLSTNLDFDEIQSRYGSRLVSRLHEQMNILNFPLEAPDYRKQ